MLISIYVVNIHLFIIYYEKLTISIYVVYISSSMDFLLPHDETSFQAASGTREARARAVVGGFKKGCVRQGASNTIWVCLKKICTGIIYIYVYIYILFNVLCFITHKI